MPYDPPGLAALFLIPLGSRAIVAACTGCSAIPAQMGSLWACPATESVWNGSCTTSERRVCADLPRSLELGHAAGMAIARGMNRSLMSDDEASQGGEHGESICNPTAI